MKRHAHAGRSYALSIFFAGTGVVLALVVGAITTRSMIAPTTQTWNSWTTGALVGLALLALALWVAGMLMALRVHRQRRDRVVTFLSPEERTRVLESVAKFEARTSGEIRVHLAEHSQGDPTRAAVRVFERLGMARTSERNGVLLFVTVRDRAVAVIGDAGIDERVPEDFWAGVVRLIELRFGEERFADGLIEGIAMAGEQLAAHFPPRAGDVNELPDSLSDDTR